MSVMLKSLRASLAFPRDLHISSLRFETGAPQLSLDELPSPEMDGSPFSKPTSKPTSNVSSSNPYQDMHPASPLGDGSSRVNTPSRPHGRRTSAASRRVLSNHEHLSSPTESPTRQTEAGDTSPWSGAVGKASLGKSGRVIERLMAEIDKLKRELNAEIQHRQEIEKREDLNSRTVDGLKAENANLQQATEVDSAVLKRRDRKIEELRADLEAEKSKRTRAEEAARQASRQMDEIIASTNKELSEARDVAKHAKGHAEVLEQSHKQLGTEYRQRTETLVSDLRHLLDDRDEERTKVKRLDRIVEQLKQEVDKLVKINTQMVTEYAAYKDGTEEKIGGMRDGWQGEEVANKTVREEAEKVMEEAQWLITLMKREKERQGQQTS